LDESKLVSTLTKTCEEAGATLAPAAPGDAPSPQPAAGSESAAAARTRTKKVETGWALVDSLRPAVARRGGRERAYR
jgi:hypothetical protein